MLEIKKIHKTRLSTFFTGKHFRIDGLPKIFSVIAFCLIFGTGVSINARDYLVDRVGDEAIVSTCDSFTPNDCNLRGAITRANTDGEASVIQFLIPTVFPQAVTLLASSLSISNDGNLLITSDDVVTSGSGVRVRISGGFSVRVFSIAPGANVEFRNVTIQNGRDNSDTGGAAILNNGGTVKIENCLINSNQSAGDGGAVKNNSGSNLTILNSNFQGNSGNNGGAVSNALGGTISASNTDFNSNTANGATGSGGAVSNLGNATITRSLFFLNSSVDGGGAIASGESLSIKNSTFSFNRTQGGGGAIGARGTVNLDSVTIAENVSDSDQSGSGSGGGFRVYFGVATINVFNSLIAKNTDNTNTAPDFNGTLTSQGYNLIGNSAGTNIVGDPSGNILNVDPRISQLRLHTQGLRSYALLPGSPAIDAGRADIGTATDQRGLPRIYDFLEIPNSFTGIPNSQVGADIGAFELQAEEFYNGVNSSGITINDNGPASQYPSTITIGGIDTFRCISKVTVTVHGLSHTFPSDLDLLLVGPGGQRTMLMSDTAGQSPGVSGVNLTFDQAAASPIPDTNPATGTYQPSNNGTTDNFPAPGPGVLTNQAANLDVFKGTNPNGDWKLYVMDDAAQDSGTIAGGWSLNITISNSPLKSPFDFDGDGRTDIGIFRPAPGEWWYLRSSDNGNFAAQFGSSTDKLVPGDYTGDCKADIAFFRPSSGEWFVLRSEDSSFYSFPFGNSTDIPAPADYDGDGKVDPAIFRPSEGNWYIVRSSDNGTTIQQFGSKSDKPVPADYDGDGKADLAIFRPDGTWWLNRSQAGVIVATFGVSTDRTVPGDYTGDGKADVAFFRPSTSEWFILRSEDASFYSYPYGAAGDIPVPGDYDGDGKFDSAVFRPSNNTWFLLRSTAGSVGIGFGATNDLPVPNAFVR
ncbi:MAG: hypothetical protein KIS76_00165 [Pyrinomonadaceae bacterium]|nr:hypothetical protein [Pyrinomonadaceae bacterium]